MKIGAISLGCDKNRVDTEKMLSRLVAGGHTIVGSEDEADIIIVNTCAFIDETKAESIDEILSALAYKKKSQKKVGKMADNQIHNGKDGLDSQNDSLKGLDSQKNSKENRQAGKKVIVTGCLSERYLDELIKEFPEVDAFLGVADYDEILDTVQKISVGDKIYAAADGDNFYSGRVLTTPFHYAYLKIADGCDNHCTYCAIPSIRGAYRSEKLADLMVEAKTLADDGVKELILVAQDVTRYGIDFDGKSHLIDLLNELCKLDFEWIRLLYLEPEMVTDELIDYVAVSPKVVKYMDIPLQHIADGVLKRMNRHTTFASTRALIQKVKDRGIAVRTSFICGFPGESEQDFENLKAFVKEAKIDFAGFFAYSREEGTPADRMDGHLDDKVKEARAAELREIQAQIIADKNKDYVGKTFKVLYDDINFDKQMFSGRAQFQAPDIDTVINFTADKQVEIGNFYNVEIVTANGMELIGRVVE
ncbi:MAG: 30S ribosomal protein S12 methylthiotransferase RimO [Clostridia bacterium]